MIKVRMRELRLLGERLAAHVERDAGVGGGAVPVAPVAAEVADRFRNLGDGGFDLLQTDHVRLRGRYPLLKLRFSGADPVHIPCRDFHAAVILRSCPSDRTRCPSPRTCKRSVTAESD